MILTRLLLAFIFVNFSNVAVSDDAPFNKMGPRKGSLEGRFERMSQVLDLTDEQKLKIKAPYVRQLQSQFVFRCIQKYQITRCLID